MLEALALAAGEPKDMRHEADKWEYAYLALSAVDAVQTCDFLASGRAYELNPILGKHPKCGEVVAFKVGMGAIHYAGYRYLRDRDPKLARLLAQVSAGMQGGVVVLNLRFVF